MRSLFLLPFLLCWLPIVEAVPIREVHQTDTEIGFTTDDGMTHTVEVSSIPASSQVSASLEETYLDSTWLQKEIGTRCQARIHVFSTSPFSATLFFADVGVTIPDAWWNE